jgi:hypothetical protein
LRAASLDVLEITMTTRKKGPPVPPASRSPKGTGADPASRNPGVKGQPNTKDAGQNPREQGQQGNIHQNIHNQGNRQAR